MVKATVLNTFRISDNDFQADETINDAYGEYTSKRAAFSEAVREFKEAAKTLHEQLDEPLRSAGFIPEGKDWTLKEDDD